jgi:hypothetical protein
MPEKDIRSSKNDPGPIETGPVEKIVPGDPGPIEIDYVMNEDYLMKEETPPVAEAGKHQPKADNDEH